jgi:hypothetical protein
MFDTSFKRSNQYFIVLQILRIFSEWIRETSRDFTAYNQTFLGTGAFPREMQKDVRANWELVLEHLEKAEQRLLQRISDKTEEVMSLRDGLFNATSLREASKSTTMNRAVIVFTIATIIYLPPSFIATVFGMDLFINDDDMSNNIWRYAVVTAVISFVTYFIVGAWIFRKRDVRENTKAHMRSAGNSIRELFKQLSHNRRSAINSTDDFTGGIGNFLGHIRRKQKQKQVESG